MQARPRSRSEELDGARGNRQRTVTMLATTIVGAAALFAAAADAPYGEDSAAMRDSGAPYTLRVEATSSTNMDVWQVMAFDNKGINMLRNCSRLDQRLPLAQQQANNCVADGRAYNSNGPPGWVPTLISDSSANWQNASSIGYHRMLSLSLLTDGVVYDPKRKKTHEFDAQTGTSPIRGPMVGAFLEFDLSRLNHSATGSNAQRPSRVDLFTAASAADNGWHTVSLLDSDRNVVSVQTLRHGVGFPKNGRPKLAAESPRCKLFIEAPDAMHRTFYDSYIYNCSFTLPAYSGDAMKIPPSAANWLPLHTTGMPTTVADAPADRTQRLAAFVARDSDSSVKALAEQLFAGGLLVRSAETAAAFVLFETGSYHAAIDAWQASFFLQLKPRNIHYSYNPALTACCSYTKAADDLLANFSVTFGPGVLTTGPDVSLAKYEVGAINWINFADDLQGVQNLAFVSANFNSLLTAYNESKAAGAANTKYIERWAALLDDWTLNFFQDADKACHAGVNAKNMFVMLGANYYGALLELMGDLERDAQISQVLPSTTMARLLLKLNAEYLPAYFRVARGTLFNHDTSGLAANYIVARYIQQFYSGKLLMHEIRDHIQRWMAYGETAYGSMIEIGDEGHFAMPLDNLAVTMDLFDQDQPAWWTPQLRTQCRDMFRKMQRYYFRHTGPGGAWHRFSHVVPNGNRFLNFNDPYRKNPICANGCGVTNTTRKIVINDTYTPWVLAQINLLYGRASGPRPTVNTTPAAKVAAAQQLYDSASKLLATYPPTDTDPSILSDYRSDVMPYAGLHYLRSGWGKSDGHSVGDIILHCIAPPGSGSVAADMSLAADPEQEGDAFFENPGACQLSMSAADVTKQAVLMPLAKLTATRVNGDSPLPTYYAHGIHPGSKTTALSYASQTPVTGRFYSGTSIDLQEPVYSGTWATATSKFVSKTYMNLTGRQEQVTFPSKHTQGSWSRTFVGVRPYRAIFSIEDFLPASTETQSLLGTSVILQLASGFAAVDNTRFTVDSSSGMVSSHNGVANQTSVTAHFAGTGLKYTASKPSKPTAEYSALFPSATFITELEVEVSRSNAAPLLSLMFPTEPGQPPPISHVTVLPTGDGIDASTHDGGKLCLRSARSTLSGVKGCFGLVLPCATVFAWCTGGTNLNGTKCTGRVEGVALGCSGGTSPSDFAFNHSAANGYTKTKIGRPLHKPTISGGSSVISKPVTLQMTSPEAAAGLAEIRFTTDGSDPTNESALFEQSKGLLVDRTMLIKAATFCAAGHCNADRPRWASDGTQVSAVQYADFTMQVPAAALPSNGTKQLKPGLCARSRVASSWSELYATSGTAAGFGTGTIVAEPSKAFASAPRCTASSRAYPQVSVDGVFTAAATGDYSFIAPEEYRLPHALTQSVGFDLRLWLDGDEVALSQLPGQGLGAWSVSLMKGPHSFRCIYTDGRCFKSESTLVPGSFYGLWADFPQPWSTYMSPLSSLSYIPPGATTPRPLGAEVFTHVASTC